MYNCTDCGMKFEFPEIILETLELKEPPYKKLRRCPFCRSGEIDELEVYHCHYCGVRLIEKGDYCNERCRRAGELSYAAEAKRRADFEKSAVAEAVREISEYNKTHGTKYSYGQYFMLKEMGGLK